MNINSWLSENKSTVALAALLVFGSLALGYLSFVSWDNLGVVTAEYNSKAADLDRLAHKTPFPSAANLRKLTQTLKQSQADLDKLREALLIYHILPFGAFDKTKPQDQPQYFQDALRSQVTAIKSLATTNGSTLPPTFYLGLDEFENRLPQPEQLPILSKQLTVLDWLAKSLVGLKGVTVVEFARIPSDTTRSSTTQKNSLPASRNSTAPILPYDSLGSTRIILRCGQGAFRELVNTISTGPYFLVIEDIKVQNSVVEPPRRDATPSTDQPTDGSTTVQRLPIVVGRESLNVVLKIRTIDFMAQQNQQEVSK